MRHSCPRRKTQTKKAEDRIGPNQTVKQISSRSKTNQRFHALGTKSLDSPVNQCTHKKPNITQVAKFWKSIIGVDDTYNIDHPEIGLERGLEGLHKTKWQEPYNLILESMRHKPSNWKAAGPDCIKAYW